MKKIEIDPQNVLLDSSGHCTRRWFVRLPEGVVADDLKDPAIWVRVQSDRHKALHRHDHLYLVEFGESFAVEARVTDATRSAAVLALQKIISFPARLTPLFSDDAYKIDWCHSGYAVKRRSDGIQLGGFFGSEALAIHHLHGLYPVTV